MSNLYTVRNFIRELKGEINDLMESGLNSLIDGS